MHAAMTQSLEQGGEHVEPNHFRLLMTCVSVCSTTATAIAGGFDIQEPLCRLCASVCRACAESCRRVGELDDCVEVCERCARDCDRLLGVPPPPEPRSTGGRMIGRQ
ncbi:MAG: four-helix bundle copper-binding protein [Povalibacter sp.]